MNKRRAHRKSRGGCTECKRRHIKCDEEKPSCLHCTRHNILCIYRHSARIIRDVSSGEDSSPQSDTSCHFLGHGDFAHVLPNDAKAPKNASDDFFDMRDMALLHHWITVAGHGILKTQDIDHYWHSVIPSIGFKHRYVMHSILSLSALHMARANPSDRQGLLRIAAEHRSRALDEFTEDIHRAGPYNSSALFANATLTFFYAFVSFSDVFHEDKTIIKARTAQILGAEWIPLARGTVAVLEPVYRYVRAGPLRSFLEVYNFDELDLTGDTHIGLYGKQLTKIQSLWATDDYGGIYDETLRILLKCSIWMKQFETMDNSVRTKWGYHRSFSGPFFWLFSAPEKYFNLQQQRQPPALVIFAYYGVLLHHLDDHWWAENCGRSIVSAVDMCLGPYWSSWLDWPKQEVGL
ncbi:sterol uptake control protein 2 [Stagonosporopsis vannaccii]|nr:sterol uptake control protein 2 [Stagonosporopsis vannaccii]